MKNKFNRSKSSDDFSRYKKQRNICVKLRKKSMKDYFQKVSKNCQSDKNFWNIAKPFITEKGVLSKNDITIIDNERIINDDKELCEIFNNHYINIVKISSGKSPESVLIDKQISNLDSIKMIIKSFENHPSIIKIKEHYRSENSFSFKNVKLSEIKKHLRNINSKKATGEDTIPPKLVKMASEHLALPLTKAINAALNTSTFPDNAKKAIITPIDKRTKEKYDVSNYRPVSVLKSSKINFLHF